MWLAVGMVNYSLQAGRGSGGRGNEMKAIDRAAYWTHHLERAGFDIECETDTTIGGREFLTVHATNGKAKVLFTIMMDTKFTRFVTGSTGYGYLGDFTRKPSQMSSLVFSEIELQRYREKMQAEREEVSA